MKVVIDIPDDVYEEFKEGVQSISNMCIISDAVFDGKPLPKGHGRLIDANALKDIIGQFPRCWEYGQGVTDCLAALIEAPTIIEAEKEV